MSYAIAEVIYGYDFTRAENFCEQIIANWDSMLPWMATGLLEAKENYEDAEDFLEHFHESVLENRYNGNGPEPQWLGFQVTSFSEGENIRLDSLPLSPSADQIKDLPELLKEIPDCIKDFFPEPATWILWSSS